MQNYLSYIAAMEMMILISACSEENPSDVFANSANGDSSSSAIEELSSSSSFNAISSSSEISSSSWEPYSYGELLDKRDRHVYKTIKIGEQTWMAENLNFDYHNRMASVLALTLPSLCYNNSRDSCAKYGRLYSWSIAMDSAAVYGQTGISCGIWKNGLQGTCKNDAYNYTRGACPENWHIPNESDINNFIKFANESPRNIEWLIHYWLYGENENIKYELLSQYGFFWSSIESDSSKAKALGVIEKNFNQFDAQKQSFYFIRCVKDEKPLIVSDYGTMTDERDGQVYKTVKIGNQWWMAENLNYAYPHKFRNLDSASWCYNNESGNCAKYGRLYMWEATMNCNAFEYTDSYYDYDDFCTEDIYKTEESFNFYRGTCPENWHIPSHDEWALLKSTVNNFATDLKSTVDWRDNGNGSDILGFSALPAGECEAYSGGKCTEINEKTCFWTTRQIDRTIHDIAPETWHDYFWASIFCLTANSKDIFNEVIDKYDYALSIRCVKDE